MLVLPSKFPVPYSNICTGFPISKKFLKGSFDSSDKDFVDFKVLKLILKWIFKSLDLGIHQSSTYVSARFVV